MPPWKVKRAQSQARGWTDSGLHDALQVVAELNAEVKGTAVDADYALERAVLRLAQAAQSTLTVRDSGPTVIPRASGRYGWSIDGSPAVALRDAEAIPMSAGAAMSATRRLRRGSDVGEAAVTARWRSQRRGRGYGGRGAYSELTRWAMADFLLAAWLR